MGQLAKYRTLVIVERLKPNLTPDASGHIDKTDSSNWQIYCRAKFELNTRPGRQVLVGDQLTATSSVVATTQRSTQTSGILEGMRLRIGSRILSVAAAPVDVNTEQKEIEFPCTEIAAL